MDDPATVGGGRFHRYWTTVSSDVPLYQRDPEAWQAHLAEGNRTQPRKRVSADVLFRDEAGQILLVNPGYKPDWDLPGGMAEANEAPLDAARREVAEELGIHYGGGRLLVVDWVAPHAPWDDSLAFIFDGGVISEAQRGSIRLLDGELEGYRFVAPEEVGRMLRPYVENRLGGALSATRDGTTKYLHNGRPM